MIHNLSSLYLIDDQHDDVQVRLCMYNKLTSALVDCGCLEGSCPMTRQTVFGSFVISGGAVLSNHLSGGPWRGVFIPVPRTV